MCSLRVVGVHHQAYELMCKMLHICVTPISCLWLQCQLYSSARGFVTLCHNEWIDQLPHSSAAAAHITLSLCRSPRCCHAVEGGKGYNVLRL
jgi:hypothetical protein